MSALKLQTQGISWATSIHLSSSTMSVLKLQTQGYTHSFHLLLMSALKPQTQGLHWGHLIAPFLLSMSSLKLQTLTHGANNAMANTSDSPQGGDYAQTVYTNYLLSPPTSRLVKYPRDGPEMAMSSCHNTVKSPLAVPAMAISSCHNNACYTPTYTQSLLPWPKQW